MKRKNTFILSRTDIERVMLRLREDTHGTAETFERGIVLNSLTEPGAGQSRLIYSDLLFQRMASLDVEFFQKLAEAVKSIHADKERSRDIPGIVAEHNPKGAALIKAWLVWCHQHNEFPSAKELVEFVSYEADACCDWGADNPENVRTARDMCKERDLSLKREKVGRKKKK